jgi:hypothetical protein
MHSPTKKQKWGTRFFSLESNVRLDLCNVFNVRVTFFRSKTEFSSQNVFLFCGRVQQSRLKYSVAPMSNKVKVKPAAGQQKFRPLFVTTGSSWHWLQEQTEPWLF